ncbi:MAG: three-Cys-motif partner protein TcmP [Caulobacterales bacterium]
MSDSRLGEHEFGGVSTDLKLSLVGDYLHAFTTALTGKFELCYVDAFAGTGERTVRHAAQDASLLEPSIEASIERRKGSARIAIETDPPFDRLVFMDVNRRHCAALERLRLEYPERRIDVVRDDANTAILAAIAVQNWRSTRGVMFLDPYGMHVRWETLQAIQATKAIDVWYLVSLAGLFRQATRDGRALSDQKRHAITRMLGTPDWEAAWYKSRVTGDLFDAEEKRSSRVASVEEIEAYVARRLRDIFPAVLGPLRLRNMRNAPMFALFFGISNPDAKAVGLATKIASHLLMRGSSSHRRSR